MAGMLSDLLRRLTATDLTPPPGPDSSRALAALLVRIARTDGDYTKAERDRIDHVLAARNGLSAAEAARLRTEAEGLEAQALDTFQFTRALKDAIPLENRVSLLEALWEIALADGERGNDEDNTMRLITSLLGLSDVDSGLARQRVAARQA